jgi:uncharacterized protein (TIGR03435 family)
VLQKKDFLKLQLTIVGLCLVSAYVRASSNGGPKVGDVSPLLSATALLQAPEGATLDAATLRGKVVVLEFWATWCGPCVAAIPHLNDLADQFKDKSVRFIATTAEDEATVQPFLKKRPIHAWVALDTNRAMNKAFAVTGIPHTVVLDKEGNIAAIAYPTELTAQHLSDLLAGKKISLSEARGEEVPNQKPSDKPALLEISVRPSDATNAGGFGWGNGKINARACTVWRTLPLAFDTTFPRIVTNAPLPAGMYDFTITEPQASEEEMSGLLQTALKVTFGVTGRKEARERAVFLLKIKASTAPGRTISPTQAKSFREGGGEISGVGVTMKLLASALEESLKKPVIDETGSKDEYDVMLRWSETDSDKGNRDAILAAVPDQLGLELIPATLPVEMTIIEQSKVALSKEVSDHQ